MKSGLKSALLAIFGNEQTDEPIKDNDEIRPGFKYILELENPKLEISVLLKAIEYGQTNKVKHLLRTNIEINKVIEETEKGPKTYPLLKAIRKGQLQIVQTLCQHGALLRPKGCGSTQPLLEAIIQSRNDRKNRDKLKIVNELLNYGADINVLHGLPKNLQGMNGLHLALTGTSGSTDEALDLEITLIKNKINLFAEKDGRYPLHELFCGDKNTKDPIEVCNLLVEAMDSKGMNKLDNLSRSALHYAAQCGATISCLLLISKGADLNHFDIYGNSPLAYRSN